MSTDSPAANHDKTATLGITQTVKTASELISKSKYGLAGGAEPQEAMDAAPA